tara:strand:- start:247 stop:1605 length:1359 start_codon:yes stop_codon:yes gene_type:complete
MDQLSLFKDIMPYGGKLDNNNRWIKLSNLVPWGSLAKLHDSYFDRKRLAVVKSGRLIIGLLIGKMKMKLSDEEILNYFYENPYFQYFCGFDNFVTKESKIMDSSLLTKRRNKLGEEYFAKFEGEILEVLKNYKLINGKELLLDATVVESKIAYPNDVKLLNTVRTYCINKISELKKTLNLPQKIRTYKRKAKEVYLDYAKKKKKSKKVINQATRKMLNFTSRNIKQLESLMLMSKELLSSKNFKLEIFEFLSLKGLIKKIEDKLITAKEIYHQQKEKYISKSTQIKDRIVSFDQPYVRPILRGKEAKKVEFGAKTNIASTKGYCFTNKIEHRAFSEKSDFADNLNEHQKRFNRLPNKLLIDDGYSSLANKDLLKKHNIKHSLKNQGRTTPKQRLLKKRLRKERSKIEGVIGNLKKDYTLEKITLKSNQGAAIQTSLAMGSFNLFKALREIKV